MSGGVRTVADATIYLALADRAFAPDQAGPANFRFGASGLLDDIVRILTGALGGAVPTSGDGDQGGPASEHTGY